MDSPTNRMVITSVLVLDDAIDIATLRTLVQERFLGFPRFRQRVEETSAGPRWEMDPHFDLTQHVHRSALPGAAGQPELQERVSELMSRPLDASKPLWDIELIEDFQGGSAAIVRIHHCIADGIALVQVLLSLTDEYFDPARFPTLERNRSLVPGIVKAPFNAARSVATAGKHLLAEGVESVLNPSHLTTRAKQGLSLGAALSKLALIDPDSDTLFKGVLSVAQRVTWSDALDLQRVKAMGRALDAKVNDVLLGAVAGALRHYLQQHGAPTQGVTVRALIPVNLRSPEKAFELGNRFGLVYADLPVYLDKNVERVREVKRQMDEIKASSEAIAAFSILEALGYFPSDLEAKAVELFSSKASAVMTNVPGPRELLHMKGRPLQYIMPWVPRAGSIGLGVSIFSYNGTVRLGVASDAHLIPDPETILAGFQDMFDGLAERLAD